MAGKTHASWQGPGFPCLPELPRPLLEGQKPRGATTSMMLWPQGSWCQRLPPREQGSAHRLPAPGTGRGRDGGPSGPSSFLEFWPNCHFHSNGCLWPGPALPPPPSRFPLLKTSSFQQESAQCQTCGTGELLRRAPGFPHLRPLTRPRPQHKGVPVLGACTDPKALPAHSSPKPDTRLCSGDTVPRSPGQPVTRRGACRPSARPPCTGRTMAGPSQREGRPRQRLPGREAQWHSEDEKGRWCQINKNSLLPRQEFE